MPRRKIKVVRCGRCGKRYGAMKEGQKCPHCARKRMAKGKTGPRRRNLSLASADFALDVLGKTRALSKKRNPRKTKPRRNPINIGDHVKFSSKWLRSTGQYTGEIPFARGVVKSIKTYGSGPRVATVDWDTSEAPSKVLTQYLIREGSFDNPRRKNSLAKISRLKGGRRMTTLEMVRAKPKTAARVRRSLERKNPRRHRGLKQKAMTRPSRREKREARITKARTGKYPTARRYARLNPRSGASMSRAFHGGETRKSQQVRVSKRFPSTGSWILGPVNYLKVKKGGRVQKIDFGRNARLVGNGKRLLGIGNARFGQRNVNPGTFTPVEVGYEKRAPHLTDGDTRLTPWKQRFGEESGRMPNLTIDSEGFGIIHGGGFHIKADGIHD